MCGPTTDNASGCEYRGTEERHSKRMQALTSLVARAVLPECYHHIFPIGEQKGNLEEIKYEI